MDTVVSIIQILSMHFTGTFRFTSYHVPFYRVSVLTSSAIDWTPSILDGTDLRNLGMVSEEGVRTFCALPIEERRHRIEVARAADGL